MGSKNTEPKKVNPVAQATSPGWRHHRMVPMLQKIEDKELVLPMVVLTGREQSEVDARAYKDTLAAFDGKAPKKDEPSNWDETMDYHRYCLTVYYSIRKPDDLTKKWFLSKEQVEDMYNPDELGILATDYISVRLTQPHLVNIAADDPNAFQTAIDRIKKMGEDSDFFLNGFTTHSVNQLLKFLVAKVETLQSSNG